MAEILLSLTIIGVVAAITLPSLTGNINERTWNTQRKALYARMSQAIALMPALNGYGSTPDNAAETFVTAGLSKVLKINNICDNTHFSDCGFVSQYTNLLAVKKNTPKTLVELNNMFSGSFAGIEGSQNPGSFYTDDTKAAALETVNGESILVFYNPKCHNYVQLNSYKYTQHDMCVNFIYDLNGSKGPNTIGKDIGVMSALYATDSVVVAPLPVNKTSARLEGRPGAQCTKQDKETRTPNIEELSSMFYNRDLLGISEEEKLWSNTNYDKEHNWAMYMGSGLKVIGAFQSEGHLGTVRCIYR